jgi:hypothetical protein
MAWVNDDLADATVISGASGSITPLAYDGTTDPATFEVGETEDFEYAGETLWWKWTAPADGDFEFNTLGSPNSLADEDGLDTWIGVYEGPASAPTFAALTLVASNDDHDGANPYIYNSQVIFAAVEDQTYYIQVDQFATGQVGTLHLTWAPYVPPPPVPVADTWVDATAFRGYQAMWAGDDLTVTGTDLDEVTSVTIGGAPQPFTIIGSTELSVHVTTSAVNGQVVVANVSGSDAAENNFSTTAFVYYPGPWITPDPVEAVLSSNGFDGTGNYGHEDYEAQSYAERVQAGAPFFPSNITYVSVEISGRVSLPDPEYFWAYTSAAVTVDATPNSYNFPPFTPAETPDDAYQLVWERSDGEATNEDYDPLVAGEPVLSEDPTVEFACRTYSGYWVDDDAPKAPGDLMDVWLDTFQFRSLPGAPPATWPTPAELAEFDIEHTLPVVLPGATTEIWTNGYEDNYATLINPDADPEFSGSRTVPWGEWDGMKKAWLVSTAEMAGDAPAYDPPLMTMEGYAQYGTGNGVHAKLMIARTEVQAHIIYQPVRYRWVYYSPPATTVPTLRRRQQGARGGIAPRRRQIGSRTGSLRRGPGAAP